MLVSLESEGDFAHTLNNFSGYLSLFQVGDEYNESRHVSAQMQIGHRSGKERNNLFLSPRGKGGRKHTGSKKCKLEIAEVWLNILQCNVTT